MTRASKVARGTAFGAVIGLLTAHFLGSFWWLGTAPIAFLAGYIGTDFQGFWKEVIRAWNKVSSPATKHFIWTTIRCVGFLTVSAGSLSLGIFLLLGVIPVVSGEGLQQVLGLAETLGIALLTLTPLASLFLTTMVSNPSSGLWREGVVEREMLARRAQRVSKEVNLLTFFTKVLPRFFSRIPDAISVCGSFVRQVVVKTHNFDRLLSGSLSIAVATISYWFFAGSPAVIIFGAAVGGLVGWLYEKFVTPFVLRKIATNSAH